MGEYKEQSILMWNSVDFNGKAFGQSKGVEFIDLPASELPKWQAAVAPVIDNYVKKMVGKGFSESEVKGWVQYLRERIDYHNSLYVDVEPGDRYAITYVPGVGTELSLNGEALGVIEGEDFAAALFALWLGDKPLDKRFRANLLGLDG